MVFAFGFADIAAISAMPVYFVKMGRLRSFCGAQRYGSWLCRRPSPSPSSALAARPAAARHAVAMTASLVAAPRLPRHSLPRASGADPDRLCPDGRRDVFALHLRADHARRNLSRRHAGGRKCGLFARLCRRQRCRFGASPGSIMAAGGPAAGPLSVGFALLAFTGLFAFSRRA